MRASSITLQKIFEQTIRYQIPLFQRPYVWTEEENWQPVWGDVRTLAERQLRQRSTAPHFLGAIVLDQLPSPTGSIEIRQVIDGQQRLTTLQLLIAALRDLAHEHALPKYKDRFSTVSANAPSFCDHPDDAFKVWPTNRDRNDYRTTMHAGSPGNLRLAYGVNFSKRRIGQRIPDAYLYFYEVLSGWLTRNGATDDETSALGGTVEERFDTLWTIVSGRLLLVAIDLESNDNAQVIFETLNARGTQLLPADLVKNYLFHMAELEKAPIEQFYDRYWRHFDENFWRTKVRQGRLKRPRIDLFLQHYLTLKTKDEVNVGHIFGVFKNYADPPTKSDSTDGTQSIKETVEDHLKRLTQYGRVFSTFYQPEKGSRAETFFERLQAIDTATVFPLLMETFKSLGGPDQPKELTGVLNDLESFLVRRMVCCLTTKNYNKVFLDLIQEVEKTGGISPDAVRLFLVKPTGDSVRWPNNEEFGNAWRTCNFYNSLSQVKQRMVLLALNKALESPKSEHVQISGALTIEHLMPQSWQEYWPLQPVNDDIEAVRQQQERRNRLLHTIGNLTLLTDKLNPALSNSAWTTKKPEIVKYSQLNLNRYFHDVSEWNEDKIEQRSQTLFEVACQVWPYPMNK